MCLDGLNDKINANPLTIIVLITIIHMLITHADNIKHLSDMFFYPQILF